jgi:transcriptional regulator NrdR family protein
MTQQTKWPMGGSGSGVECRECGCRHFEVLYTRRLANGVILRRRACRHCGRRLTTYEAVAENQA